jgi:hypothetical protein
VLLVAEKPLTSYAIAKRWKREHGIPESTGYKWIARYNPPTELEALERWEAEYLPGLQLGLRRKGPSE